MNTLSLGRMSRPVTSLVAGAIVVLTVTACNGDTPPKPTDVPPPATTSTPASTSGSPSEPVETTTPASSTDPTDTPSTGGGTPANIKDAPLPEKIGEFTLGENLLTGIPEYQHPTDAATAVGFTGYDLPVSEFELQKQVAADFGEVVDLAGGAAFCWEQDGDTPCYIKTDKYAVVGVTGTKLPLEQVKPFIEEIAKAIT